LIDIQLLVEFRPLKVHDSARQVKLEGMQNQPFIAKSAKKAEKKARH